MKYYDVTLEISPELPVWPGNPRIELERTLKIEEGANANVSRLSLGVHTGTHVDAPYHFLPEGHSVESLLLEDLVGRAHVVDMTSVKDVIGLRAVQSALIPRRATRVLLKTRNSRLWKIRDRGFHEDFVGVDQEAAAWLVERGIRVLGVDYLSVAPWKRSRPTHEILLKNRVVVIEGLNLSAVRPGAYTLYCLPLKLKGCDGAPARVVLAGP